MPQDEEYFDAVILANSGQALATLGFAVRGEQSTVHDLVVEIASSLKRSANQQQRLPSIFAKETGNHSDVRDAVAMSRGGGVILFLLSNEFFRSEFHVDLLRVAAQLMDVAGVGSRILLYSLESGELYSAISSSVGQILAGVRVERRPSGALVKEVAFSIAENLKVLWSRHYTVLGKNSDECMMDVARMAFSTVATATSLRMLLGLPETLSSPVEAIFYALKRGRSVEDIRKAAIVAGAEMRWFEAYSHKVIEAPLFGEEVQQTVADVLTLDMT